MFTNKPLVAGVLIASVIGLSHPAGAAPYGVKIGVLDCRIDSGWGYVFGSSKDVHCTYHPAHGDPDVYVGSISKFGLDLGYTSGGMLAWDVIAPASDVRAGALEGGYGGATASVTVAAGLGANVLLGGFDKSIALQPISFESNSGLDVAAGIGELTLKAARPEPSPVAAMQPVPPATPFPRASTDVRVHTLTVPFAFDKATLTPDAREVIRDAAIMVERTRAPRILVTGHADRVGTDRYNDRLSLQRAEAVRAELVRDGVDDSRILFAGRGFHDPVVPTKQGIREAQNRRVVIELRGYDQQRDAAR